MYIYIERERDIYIYIYIYRERDDTYALLQVRWLRENEKYGVAIYRKHGIYTACIDDTLDDTLDPL